MTDVAQDLSYFRSPNSHRRFRISDILPPLSHPRTLIPLIFAQLSEIQFQKSTFRLKMGSMDQFFVITISSFI